MKYIIKQKYGVAGLDVVINAPVLNNAVLSFCFLKQCLINVKGTGSDLSAKLILKADVVGASFLREQTHRDHLLLLFRTATERRRILCFLCI